jgi:hypothetical protein
MIFKWKKDLDTLQKINEEPSASQVSLTQVGRENLSDALSPHEDYEGHHRFDLEVT